MTEIQEVVSIVTTYASESDAVEAAKRLIGLGLAACVQVEPIRSIYRWNNQDCDQREWRIAVKTSRSRVSEAIAAIRMHHPYEAPEIVAFEAIDADPDYSLWVARATRA